MNACSIRQNAADKIITDGFELMKGLVNQYEANIDDFISYLKSFINKNCTYKQFLIY